jgi:hypothetical protein
MQMLIVLALWYGFGAAAAAAMIRRGHHRGVWTFAAALLGTMIIPAAMISRLHVRLRFSSAGGMIPQTNQIASVVAFGRTALVLLDAEDSPDAVVEQVARVSSSVDGADVVVVVPEETWSSPAGRADLAMAGALASYTGSLLHPLNVRSHVAMPSGVHQFATLGANRPMAIVSNRLVSRPFNGSPVTQAASLSRLLGTCVVVPAPDTGRQRRSKVSPDLAPIVSSHDSAASSA